MLKFERQVKHDDKGVELEEKKFNHSVAMEKKKWDHGIKLEEKNLDWEKEEKEKEQSFEMNNWHHKNILVKTQKRLSDWPICSSSLFEDV
ncbi:hypothetical protein VP01_13287g2 [Puccinia sorghi]|uniref:Uncharacterized protein n=1 Tax=Puccinia sorghi TaxID=27349 RepID=A0A0L6VN39_9BASI|nr:hypothetical protein VP01_13287g2 [Puccinia sorghi]